MKFTDRSCLTALAMIGGLAITAGGAAAQGLAGQSFYVKGFGGLTVPQSDDFDLNDRASPFAVDTGFDMDNGYTLGIAGGWAFTPNIAFEIEYAYRNADASLKGLGTGSKQTESNAFMANAVYNFTPSGPNGQWQPYAGIGLGAADLNYEGIDALGGGDFDSDYNFAYQLFGGVGYALNPNMMLLGEARFFGINDQELENDDWSFKTTYQTFDLLLGLTYRF